MPWKLADLLKNELFVDLEEGESFFTIGFRLSRGISAINNNNNNNSNNNNNNNNNNDLLTDPLGVSSLLNYIDYDYKINQIKLFTNYTVEAWLTESNYSKTN